MGETKPITLVKQGWISSAVDRITEQWYRESLPKYGKKQTREIPTGKRGKKQYITQVICDSNRIPKESGDAYT